MIQQFRINGEICIPIVQVAQMISDYIFEKKNVMMTVIIPELHSRDMTKFLELANIAMSYYGH